MPRNKKDLEHVVAYLKKEFNTYEKKVKAHTERLEAKIYTCGDGWEYEWQGKDRETWERMLDEAEAVLDYIDDRLYESEKTLEALQ